MLQDNESYKIEYEQDGVHLVVNPSENVDRNFILSSVVKELNEKGITQINKQSLMLAINSADGKSVKIAETKQESGQEPKKETKLEDLIKITLSSDKMSASLTLSEASDGKKLSGSDILSSIKSKGIIYGVDHVLISKLAIDPTYNEPIEFAKGQPVQKGEDGKLELLFDINAAKKPKVLEDGSVDFHELNSIVSVSKDQVLAKIYPPGDGIFGKNVLGQVLKAPKGKPVRNPRGKNVEITDDGKKVVSTIDGHASFVDNRINVLNVLEIPGNVDISTGNIRFNGNVIVKGNVQTDFVIEAKGNVEVYGVVEGATIKADGDIILKRGIQGLNKGNLESKQDVISHFIEHCTVSAGNNIKTESIMHCNINCGGSIELVGNKGLIVGGNVKVSKIIDAKVIGSRMSTPTNIEIGVDPGKRDRYKEAKEKFDELRKELQHIDKSVEILSKMKETQKLNLQKSMMLAKMIKSKPILLEELEDLKQEIEQLDEDFNSINESKIIVRSKIYTGVKVTIGSLSKFIKDVEELVVILIDGGDIVVKPYK